MALLDLKHIHTYSSDRITLENLSFILTPESNMLTQWFLPSYQELMLMYNVLHLSNVGNFAEERYWSSTEGVNGGAKYYDFSNGSFGTVIKSSIFRVRAVRVFTDESLYQLRDIGPQGGYIFNIINNLDGTYSYYECSNTDQSAATVWDDVDVYLGTTSSSIGEGLSNTEKIISQINFTEGAALLCYRYHPSFIDRKSIHEYISSMNIDIYKYNTTTKLNINNINLFNKLYSTPRDILYSYDSNIINDVSITPSMLNYSDALKNAYLKSTIGDSYYLISSVSNNSSAIIAENFIKPSGIYSTEIYTPRIEILGSEFGFNNAISSGAYTLIISIEYTNGTIETITKNIIYYAPLAVCIRKKLNNFVLDCNRCKDPNDMIQFFIAESSFQSLQYFEEDTIDVTAINRIIAALNTYCNQTTCKTC